MGFKDVLQREIMRVKPIFAGVVSMCTGLRINGDDLGEWPLTSTYAMADGTTREVHRDNAMIWTPAEPTSSDGTSNGAIFCIFGVESQTAVDKTMVARVMFYDIMDYITQIRENPNEIRPVVTFVLYYGEKPWNGPRTLRELVQFLGDTEQSLLPYFNDYKLNIIDFHTITPEEIAAIPGDFRFYATFLYNMAHRDAKIVFPGVENTTLAKRFVKVFCNADDEIIFPDERLKEGGYEMNELVANYLDYERMQNAKVYVANHCEEWLEQGIEKGREEGRQEERQATEQKLKGAAQNLYQKNFTSIQIAEMLNVDQAMVEHWLDEI